MVYGKVLDRWLPETCPGCRGTTERGFCSGCAAEFVPVEAPCGRCGLPCPVRVCPRRLRAWHVEHVLAPFRYAYPLDRAIHALKFQGARKVGRALGLLLVDPARARAAEIDALVAVPLHRRRLRERGYNQAWEIARTLALELGVVLLVAGITRSAPTPALARLPASARMTSAVGAFCIRRNLAGRRLAVVDDVLTTGATVNALAEALRRAGASRVEGWAVARTAAPAASEPAAR